MATYTGPVTPIWKVFDDKNGQLLAVKEKPEGVLPRNGEMLHDIDEHHTHREISRVGELTAEDLMEKPPLLYYPIRARKLAHFGRRAGLLFEGPAFKRVLLLRIPSTQTGAGQPASWR